MIDDACCINKCIEEVRNDISYLLNCLHIIRTMDLYDWDPCTSAQSDLEWAIEVNIEELNKVLEETNK